MSPKPKTPDVAVEDLVHTILGKCWETDDEGNFVLPEHSLGWEIAAWCSYWLENEDGGTWEFTSEQLRFILWWYAIDRHGEFVYRVGVLQRLKGWGKDPLLAVICMIELCGPSRFSHWGEDGLPRGKRHPSAWVQVAAVARDQTANTTKCFQYLASERFKTEYQVEMGIEFIRAFGGRSTIEIMSNNFRKAEGNRTTFSVLGETHHWVAGNGGPKMFDTVTDNATKGGNRYLSITNAYMPGEDSVAETQRAAYMDILEGRAPDIGFLYDSIEADPRTPLTPEALRVVIPQIRGDAVWLNPEPIIAKIMQTNHNPARARRMWLNMIFADSDGLFQEADWKALQTGHEGEELSEGEEIVLGFDGGKSDDATALIAIRVHDNFIFPLLIEERPPVFERDRYWEVDRDKVDRAVREAFEKYKVKAFYADVALWESYLALWAEEYGETVAVKASERNPFHWDMRGNVRRVTLANEFLMRSIFDKRLKHAGPVGPMKALNAALRRHVLNARRRENVYGVSFGKESKDSPLKVDGYAALMLALQALNDYKQKGQRKKVRTGRGYFF